MSRAEELAKRSRRISEILMSNGTVNTLRVIKYCIESETELRRLAQVEVEHAALKEELEAEREETKRWLKKAVDLKDVADEYKKLAEKILAEHAALLKAISDAEPVAEIRMSDGGLSVVNRVTTKGVQVSVHRADGDWTPLYTLNGIKK